jgi:uncharacterized protein (DUF1501 family)
MKRRDFLKKAMLGTCGGAIHQILKPAGSMLAWADPLRISSSGSSVMVVINLAGGASYNTAPLYDGTYRDKNPTVSYSPETSIPLSAAQGLHPALTAMKGAWDIGNLALINMVGYPNPNRSHAESTDIWFRGAREMKGDSTGWAARLTCQLGGLFSGVSLAGSNTLVSGECNPPRALEGLTNVGENNMYGGQFGEWLRLTRENLMFDHAPITNNRLGLVKNRMDIVSSSLKVLRDEAETITLPTTTNSFPANANGFVGRCRDATKLIASSKLGVRFIYLEKGGFDTHSQEKPRLTELLTDINNGLTPMIEALQALGRWQDVTIITMSEFCRTFENGSAGTDHGHSGPMFVMGGKVAGGIKSPQPTANQTNLYDYYRDYSVDFRQIFKETVAQMGLNADAIFPEQISYANLKIFA